MGKSLLGLKLLLLWTVASGQGAIASEIEDVEAVATEAIAQPTTTVTDWLAQIEASLVQITGVRLEATEAGLQVILETAEGEVATPTTTVSGDALIVEIPNAVLALPEGDRFQQFEPTEGIALVQVTELSDDRVQVVITGTDVVPTAKISTTAVGLMLSLTPGDAQAEQRDEDTLQIVVTGQEGSRYVRPDTTTATRTNTPLRDIPQSIQVIPRELLEDQQVTGLNDALRNASGVVLSEGGSDNLRFIIRGFNDPSILRDGFRLAFGGFGNPGNQELANLETVEVLKGPASILFGSIEPGGVINLVTEQPLSEPFYEFSLRVGSRTLIEPSLDFSGPLTEDGRLLYRLNALHRTQNSVQDYDTDFERFFIAPVVRWQISDRTDLTVNFEYLDSEGPLESSLVALGDEIADIPFDRVLGEPDDFFQTEIIRVGYDFEHGFSDNWTFRNAFRYNRRETEASQFSRLFLNEPTGDLIRGFSFQEQTQSAFELQTYVVGEFNTGTIGHTLLAGIDLARFVNPLSTRVLPLGGADNFNIFAPVYGVVPRPDLATTLLFNDRDFQTNALGIYIQDQIDLLDNLILLAGVRYDTVDQELILNPSDFNPNRSESTQSDSAFTPRIGLVYQPIEEVSLYSSFSRSFFPNSGITRDEQILPPERGEQFEIGARAELLEGRLIATLAWFNVTKQNVANPDPNDPTNTFSVATGEQRSQGIELDIAGEVLPGWNIIANYAFTDAAITEDNTGLEGNRLFGVPEHNFNLWTTYDIQSGSLEGLSFGLGFNYVSERFGGFDNSFTVDSYFLTNLAVAYERDNWRAGLNIRNLFDIDYVESVRNSRLFFNTPGAGLTVIGSFGIEF